MIGPRRINPDRKLFIRNAKLIAKMDGNKDQRVEQTNDIVQGVIADEIYTDVAVYNGGELNQRDSYESEAHVKLNTLPNF